MSQLLQNVASAFISGQTFEPEIDVQPLNGVNDQKHVYLLILIIRPSWI